MSSRLLYLEQLAEKKSTQPQNPDGPSDRSLEHTWRERFDHLDAAVAQLALDGTSLVRHETSNAPRGFTSIVDPTLLRKLSRQLEESEFARDELSRRMTNVQEANHTRIARELHDDIGQSLAILKIQMVRAGQPTCEHPERTYGDPNKFVEKVDAIIRKVNRLSHDLHSSELEYLGLAVAVKSHCRERSDQLRMPIQCHCTNVERELDSVIALAFLRVVQEAIHNAIKHSRANTIMVRLNSSDGFLNLEISDDGVGFDMEVTRHSAGLGLISMRERIHLIGGKFNIFSSPGNGTRIVTNAPVTENNNPDPFSLKSRVSVHAI